MKTALFLILLLPAIALYSQSLPFTTDHTYHLNRLTSAKDSLYNIILEQYDTYIKKHPADETAQLHRCKFINAAYYDNYEDENPNYEEAQACAETLLSQFPDSPDVLLYPTEFLYGDTLLNYLTYLERNTEENPRWESREWEIYKQLTEQHGYNENYRQVIHYGAIACSYNDTLDLSILMAEAYKSLSNNASAIQILELHIDSTDLPWVLNRKGTLLLELGSPHRAIEVLRLASRNNQHIQNAGTLAKALIGNGLIEEAREYLLKDYESSNTWDSMQKLNTLMEYDLKHGVADSATLTYQKLTADNFYADAFGIYRLRLFTKDPFLPWSLADVGRILLLLLLLIVPVVIPYLWVLPMHYLGTYQRERGGVLGEPTFHWGLRHLWIASSALIAAEVIANLAFNYTGVLSYFDSGIYAEEESPVNITSANFNILFFILCATFCFALLRIEDIKGFFSKLKDNARHVGIGIGLAFLLRIGSAVYAVILQSLGISLHDKITVGLATINDVIISINKFYSPFLGFLLVVIIVPFYEEILFRGVLLSASQRSMKFMFANLLQATAFALVHNNLILFPFYFAFGIIAGYYTRKSGILIIGTSMHIMNNLMAFIAILLLSSRL